MADDGIWLALGLGIVLGLALWLRKTDYAVGCKRYRENGCGNPTRGKCTFPDCSTSRNYRPKRLFIW